jgi:hypothetical protein
MAVDLKSYMKAQIELGLRRFVADFLALDESARSESAGGVARTPYDFAFELATMNRDYARRLHGESSDVPQNMDFHRAPEHLRSAAQAVADLELATYEFLTAWDQLTEASLGAPVGPGLPTPLSIATTCSRHLHYHDAQLNFIQTLRGDVDVHW